MVILVIAYTRQSEAEEGWWSKGDNPMGFERDEQSTQCFNFSLVASSGFQQISGLGVAARCMHIPPWQPVRMMCHSAYLGDWGGKFPVLAID